MDSAIFYLLAAGILFGGSLIQSATGFGYGMFAVNLLLLAGLPPYMAIPMVSLSVVVNALGGLVRHRSEIPFRSVLPLLPLALAAQPVGVWLLGQMVHSFTRGQVRQVFGAILLIALALRSSLRPRPRRKVHPAWGAGAMGLCGIGSGLAGMGGPPVVLWTLAHDWSVAKIRSALWLTFALLGLTNFFWQYQRFGPEVLDAVWAGFLLTPAAFAGMLPGLWIGHRLSRKALQACAIAILLIIGLYAIFQPILAGVR